MSTLSEAEIAAWKERINAMTQMEMAELRRFAPAGHPVFSSGLPLFALFEARFKALGGMTPAISKQIGW